MSQFKTIVEDIRRKDLNIEFTAKFHYHFSNLVVVYKGAWPINFTYKTLPKSLFWIFDSDKIMSLAAKLGNWLAAN